MSLFLRCAISVLVVFLGLACVYNTIVVAIGKEPKRQHRVTAGLSYLCFLIVLFDIFFGPEVTH